MIQRVLMIAGEASGDAHGAGVVRELKRRIPGVEIFGIGGDKMRQEGMNLIYHIREFSFMGFVEVIKHLPLIRSVEKTLEQLLLIKKPDVVVLIDYPGFNLRFARIAKKYGIRTAYYVSPQVWAWKKGRIKKMRDIIDIMLCVFPFEIPLYQKERIPVAYVGHPLVEEITELMTRENFCKRYSLDPGKKILAIIPGSRKQEIKNIFSVMVRAAMELSGKEGYEVVVAAAPTIPVEMLRQYLPPGARVTFIEHATHEAMKYAHLAYVTSGTATLETAILGTPMIVVYRTSMLTYVIARAVVKINFISLVNILAEKKIVPELIQHKATVQNLVAEARALLESPEKYQDMKKELNSIRQILGEEKSSLNVVNAILSLA